MKQVSVLVGAGSIGQAIIRRVSAGKHIVLADYSEENAKRAAKTLEDAGFECSTIQCDLGSKEDILRLVEFATSKGDVTNVVNAAGVSPSQAPVEEILRVDLYGSSVLLEEFGKVIALGGSGVVVSSQSGHRLPALTQEQNWALAMPPTEELLDLDFLSDFAKRNGKLLAMTECGFKNTPDSTWWTRVLKPIMDRYPLSYFLTWRNYSKEYFGPSKDEPSSADFKKLYEAENTLFLKDIAK